MELKNWTYDEYPEFTMDGIEVIDTTGDEIRAKYIPNVVYAQMDGVPLHLQILKPRSRNHPEGTRKYPCIIYVQGSAWMKQDVCGDIPLVSKYAQMGYVCAIVEYRHSGIAAFPAQIIDAKNAVRFMRKNADLYDVDPDKIIMAGNSSGGHTAVYAGLMHNDDTSENIYPGISAECSCVINFYGSTSFMAEDSNPITTNHCMPDSPEGMVAGGIDLNKNEEMKRKLSLDCVIDENTDIKPVLIFHGTKDRTVNPSCSAAVYNRLIETGHEAYFYLIKGADHGGAEFGNPEVLKIIDQFIKKNI